MEEELANLSLLDDEEEAFQEEALVVERTYQFCLVGRCLTDSVVHFPSLRNTMADLWHPIGGICITDLGEKRDFCGKFLDYDTSIPTLGHKKYMRIHVCLDVSAPLKLLRRRNTAVSRWLREVDGSQCNAGNLLKCGFENGIDIGAIGSRGGLSLGWNENSLLTGFYGNPDERCRDASWDLLRQVSYDHSISWVVLGDFNEIANSFQKKGGRLRPKRQMTEFRMALEYCSLNDLGFIG
ncbi:hypothetical protein Gogos_020745 [Gossypium gossypioides]|uniref:DUF4283 domain-containing protein n=1 Tax=Gossypium gossypioides TaxID=34282 RepID=A0A7J9D471_GOSGO|nr:hypothetical protein [Gossypium gossypioides]